MYELLKKLTATAAVSGREGKLADLLETLIALYADEVKRDTLGNLIAVRRGSGDQGEKKKILLSAHMDEIGFFVTYIEASGLLRITPVGAVDFTASAMERVVSETGVKGLLVRAANADKNFSFDQFYIDIGATDRKDAERRVTVGDFFTAESGVTRLMHKRVAGRPLDDRAGCAVLLKVAEEIAKTGCRDDLYYVFSVQEEVGCRGARTAAAGISPDFAITFDMTSTGDVPGAKPMACKLGGGAAIKLKDGSVITDAELSDALRDTAKKNGIPVQYEVVGEGATDSSAIQSAGFGCRVAALSVPARYLHSGVETCDLSDMEACARLAVAFLSGK